MRLPPQLPRDYGKPLNASHRTASLIGDNDLPFCPNCGAQIDPNATFCPYCGTRLTPQPINPATPQPTQPTPYSQTPQYNPPPPSYPYTNEPTHRTRPTGVTLIAILAVINGISYILSEDPIALLIGAIWFILTYGLLTGKRWAWPLTLAFMVVDAIFNIFGLLSIFSLTLDAAELAFSASLLALDLVILYYLTRPHVKAYFGRGTTITT